MAPTVIDRVNTYYGWRCIGKLVLKQGPVRRVEKKKPSAPTLTPADREKVNSAIEGVEEDGLKAALDYVRAGDCLVVCLNSDDSVRRLKGPDRPLVGQEDRAAVLRSLRCVDDVLLFDEETPTEAIRRLRPDVWVKGADYEADSLPEADVVRELGGRIVTVPYVAGRSTTRLIERAGVGVR